MDTPVLALRFRDGSSVDTIEAHNQIIQDKEVVWWGWWKKLHEPTHSEFFDQLADRRFIKLYIVNRDKRKMYEANAEQWVIEKPNAIKSDLVPEYYRENIENIFGWFLLTNIDEIDYDDEIGESFGDSSFIELSEDGKPKNTSNRKLHFSSAKSTVLHLSDIHVGEGYAYATQGEQGSIGDRRKTLTECLVADLIRKGKQNDIAAIIVTGDFVNRGEWNDDDRKKVLLEFRELRKALGLKPEQIIPVPGNHDVSRYSKDANVDPEKLALQNQATYKHEESYRLFVEELTGRSWKEPLNYTTHIELASTDLIIGVLNSCAITPTQWTEYGYVGHAGLNALKTISSHNITKPTLKIMALHHHLLPVVSVAAPSSKGVSLSLDAPALLDAAQDAGVQIALHGHQHVPRISKYGSVSFENEEERCPITIISNGSTGVGKDRRNDGDRNTYCYFEFKNGDVRLCLRELKPDGTEAGELFYGDLEVVPTMPN